jgi:hypothetical protein
MFVHVCLFGFWAIKFLGTSASHIFIPGIIPGTGLLFQLIRNTKRKSSKQYKGNLLRESPNIFYGRE